MRRLMLIITIGIMMLLCFGCTDKSIKVNITNADKISIYYGQASHTLVEVRADAIKDLSSKFTSLTFKPTNEKIDYETMFKICFYDNEDIMASVSVDKNGVFYISGRPGAYKVSFGFFDYELLKNIYAKSSAMLDIENPDDVVIFYGFSSYAMFGADSDTIKALANQLNSLTLAPSDKKTDFSSMLRITFYNDGDIIASVSVDKNSVFWINGNYYEMASGTFNYDYAYKIYLESKYR